MISTYHKHQYFFPVQFYENLIYSFDLMNVSLLPSRFYGNAYCTTRYFPEQTRAQKKQKVIFHVTNLFDSKSTGNEKEILSDFILAYLRAVKLIICIFLIIWAIILCKSDACRILRQSISLYKYYSKTYLSHGQNWTYLLFLI